MSVSPRQILCDLATQRGQVVIDNARLLESLLRDLCGEYKPEIAALLSALRALIPSSLKITAGIPHSLMLSQMTQRLHSQQGLEVTVARWAVESWALALGVIDASECTSPDILFIPNTGKPTAPKPKSSKVDKQYEIWKGDLYDFSKRNPLLYYKPTQASSLEILRPDIFTLYDLIAIKGKPLAFPQYRADPYLPEPGSPPGTRYQYKYTLIRKGDLECNKQEGYLTRALGNIRNMARSSRTELGLNSLYLAFGILQWKENNSSIVNSAPLILVPADVVMKEGKEKYILSFFDDDIVLNPTLSAFMSDPRQGYKLDIPDFQDDPNITLKDYLSNVGELVAKRQWKLEYKVVLRLFSFQTIRMGKDMDQAQEFALYPTVIRLLSGEHVELAQPDSRNKIDDPDSQLHPQEFFQVLEADASQVGCLATARSGNNLVLHGPPGTGKSQTIVNLIAQAIADHKTVLFVSQKKAALDVVYRRLSQLELNKFCLQVHSDKANKKAVLNDLELVYHNPKKPSAAIQPQEYTALYSQRQRLNQVAQDLNNPLGNLRWTVQQVQGRLFQLRNIPIVGSGIRLGQKQMLDVDLLEWQAMQNASRGFVTAYTKLGCDPDAHPWRYLITGITPAVSAEIQSRLSTLLETLDKTAIFCNGFSRSFCLPEGNRLVHFRWMLHIAKILEAAPPLLLVWFDETQRPAIRSLFINDKLASSSILEGRDKLKQLVLSEAFYTINHKAWVHSLDQNMQCLNQYLSSLSEAYEVMRRKEIEDILVEADSAAEKAVQIYQRATKTLGYGFTATTSKLEWLGKLARLCATNPRPAPGWFDLANLTNIRRWVQEAIKAASWYAKSESRIRSCWSDEVLALDVEQTRRMLEEKYKGSIKRLLSSEYRAWQKGILCFWHGSRKVKHEDLLSLLQDLKKIQKSETWIKTNDSTLARNLGARYQGLHSDFNAISKGIDKIEEIILIFGAESIPDTFQQILCEGSVGDKDWTQLANQVELDSSRLRIALYNLSSILNQVELAKIVNDVDFYKIESGYEFLHMLNQRYKQLMQDYDTLTIYFEKGKPSFQTVIEALTFAGMVVSAEASFKDNDASMRQYFGFYYDGLATEWAKLESALQTADDLFNSLTKNDIPDKIIVPGDANVLVSAEQFTYPKGPRPIAQNALRVGAALEQQFSQQIEKLLTFFINLHEGFGNIAPTEVPFSNLHEWAEQLLESVDSIPTWEQYADALHEIGALGLEDIITEVLHSQKISLEQLPDVICKRFYQLWLSEAYANLPIVGKLKVSQHNEMIQTFHKLDQRLMTEQSHKVLLTWQNNLPPMTDSVPDSQAGILAREFQKKKANIPLRRLFNKIPDLLFKLKPCFLMSPLSVAAYLDLEQFRERFDIIIFDEASQVKPAFAIGAILRGKQVIVAGDTQQLPPTNFFQVTGDLEEYLEDDESDENSEPLESILNEFIGLPGVSQSYLLWHYRSRHESLIQFSNWAYYNQSLITFPNPSPDSTKNAIRFIYARGVYDRGKSRQNAEEAHQVIRIIEEHLKIHGDKLSLGVITFSIAQENAIREELRHQMEDPLSNLGQFAEFLNEDSSIEEPFFMKSLERVQGDERDTIIISVGYGPDTSGKVSQNFGPINTDGGERRLNVAITRAKQELYLVTSLTSGDIHITEKSKPGLRDLKRFIEYCQGIGDINNRNLDSSKDLAPFEASIQNVIENLGYKVEARVGLGSYKIDLAIHHPDHPNEYAIGIECDGDAYASAKTARDREWLRQQVLLHMGWKKILRQWSREWMDQPDHAIQQLKKAIEESINDKSIGIPPSTLRKKSTGKTIESGPSSQTGPLLTSDDLKKKLQFSEYRCFISPRKFSISDQKSRGDLLREIVQLEQPIHKDVLFERWSAGYFTNEVSKYRMKKLFILAADRAVSLKRVKQEDDFFRLPNSSAAIIPRTPAVGQTPRKIEQLALEEIAALACQIMTLVYGISRFALARKTCELLGYKALSGERQVRINATIDWMIKQGKAIIKGESVFTQ
jgi:very-short-patch-repair endonuclease/DNA polymerase III delta prime subunit